MADYPLLCGNCENITSTEDPDQAGLTMPDCPICSLRTPPANSDGGSDD